MEMSKDKCTLFLILASILVLVIDYGLISFDQLSLAVGSFSFSGIKSNSNFLYPVSAFAIVAALVICHSKYVWAEIAAQFHQGYRESPDFVELIRMKIAEAVKSDRYGSCYGGLRPSLKIKQFDLGKFTTDDGILTASVIVRPDTKIHIKGCVYGVIRALSFKLWFSVYAPYIFGVWALYRVIV